ncbi:hypothetical protein FB565_006171 [Actinoplanes lutulentus]|uniref:hypothetical protein n=1 Tax=Actinoplanes lutulentus TaxID=1287878 RepID=UPI0011B949C7|nr:hypothetical protein [Actinoplanes lutulentus]MBB2946403.1 hypothetical protein [Actinoplanes lutulentus]
MKRARPACSILGLGVITLLTAPLSACARDQAEHRVPEPTETPPGFVATLGGFAGPVLARLTERTGPWTATLGELDDTGALFVFIACAGGGSVVTTYATASTDSTTITTPCGSRPHEPATDPAVGRGPMTITVQPDGDQQWSALIARKTPG